MSNKLNGLTLEQATMLRDGLLKLKLTATTGLVDKTYLLDQLDTIIKTELDYRDRLKRNKP